MNRRLWWVKFPIDFAADDRMDLLLNSPNGTEYVLLYILLCLRTANNEGRLFFEINSEKIPYSFEDFARFFPFFPKKVVKNALEILKKFELIYYEDGLPFIANIEEMTSSEGASAKRVREHRARQKAEEALQCNGNERYIVTERREDKIREDKRREEQEEKNKSSLSLLSDNDLSPIYQQWGKCMTSRLTEHIAEELEVLAEDFGVENVTDAIQIAASAGKPSLAYVKGVLRNRRDGKTRPMTEAQRQKEELEKIRERMAKLDEAEREAITDEPR